MKRVIAVVLLSAFTASAWDATGIEGKVEIVEIWGNGNVQVFLQGNPVICAGATSHPVNAAWLSVGAQGVTPETLRTLTATLTSASLAGRKVRLYGNLVSGWCQIGAVQLLKD